LRFLAGIGTGGTLTGVGRRLRAAHPAINIATVVPEHFPGIEGLKPLRESCPTTLHGSRGQRNQLGIEARLVARIAVNGSF
jgi:cysteine synthase